MFISNFVHYEAWVNNTISNKDKGSSDPVWLKNQFTMLLLWQQHLNLFGLEMHFYDILFHNHLSMQSVS